MVGYLSRRLKLQGAVVLDNQVDEGGLLALGGNKVILGEPGMGKSELMGELGRRIGVEPVTAIRFISARNPAKLVSRGKPVLIDGLDEAISRREGDVVDGILAQLEDAGSPPFVLSCRSREWQERNVSTLRQLYGEDPNLLTLEPFDHSDACAYLAARHPGVDADRVLDHLAAHSLEELYRNPLTLGLMGRVAETDTQLPSTRAALFERVCGLVWPEHDADRQDEGLSQLTEDEALDAAGAIAAALLFSGSEAASAAGAAQVQTGDLRLADLERLSSAKATRAIFSSKLFHSVGPKRAKPIHRVVAEYLGARWLARQARTPRQQRRLLAQLHGSGSVPASLRGLHAWLAYHSPGMAERVIAKDPYGVLRYGETVTLTAHLADSLLEALRILAHDDPHFRASDWDSRTAQGLMVPVLKNKIDAIIASGASNGHLRSLLVEGLVGKPLAGALTETLETIIMSRERFFSERDDAAEALLPYRDRSWWQTTIAQLTAQGGDDAPRLARQLIQHIDADVSDGLLVETLFAEMGVTSCPLPRPQRRRIHTLRSYDRLYSSIPSNRLVPLLDLIAEYSAMLRGGHRETLGEIADVMAHLMVRAIDEDRVQPSEAASLWRWLGVIEMAHPYNGNVQKTLAARLGEQHALRHAVQTHALTNDRADGSLAATAIHLDRRLVGLEQRPDDVIQLFESLATLDIRDSRVRQEWKDLVLIGCGGTVLDPNVRAAADAARQGDKPLADFLRKLERNRKVGWQLRQEKEEAKRARKREVAFATARREFETARDALRAGELSAITNPAKTYFNHFHDLPGELSPKERLNEWLGPRLCEDALAGFEAVLHRSDLPTASEIANGFAGSTFFNYSFAIMAGLYERLRNGQGLADLSVPLKRTALLVHNDHGWKIEPDSEALRGLLEAEVLATPEARCAFAQLWIEPALAAGRTHVSGLYKLAHDPDWQPAGATLAARWLAAFPKLPDVVEIELVDCLTHSGEFDALRDIAEVRATTVFRNFDHMLSWLAIDVLVRFDAARPHLDGIGATTPEFIFFLRNRLQLERRGEMLPLTVAQAEWVISEFRERWPYAVLYGSGSGTNNDYDATDFLRALIARLANDTSLEAGDAMVRLIAATDDGYTDTIRHMAVEQRQKRAEEHFSTLAPRDLVTLLDDGPPGNIDDLKALVLQEIDVARRKLLGEDLDSLINFWSDVGVPRDENRCRDQLAAMIGPELFRYDIQRITEADMPQTKRADLAFSRQALQLPIEVKGQWHTDVWDAATGQLDAQYLIDWRSEQRGIYCVLWFGDQPSASNRRLKTHPDNLGAPEDAQTMRRMLIDRIPETRRAMIDVVVLDLITGRL